MRGHYDVINNNQKVLVFKEKGVDVRMAVDMVSLSCDGRLNIALIASSDSDLQPAVREIRNRGKICIYIGFENKPNKGFTYTTNKTILIRNAEVLKFYQKTLL